MKRVNLFAGSFGAPNLPDIVPSKGAKGEGPYFRLPGIAHCPPDQQDQFILFEDLDELEGFVAATVRFLLEARE